LSGLKGYHPLKFGRAQYFKRYGPNCIWRGFLGKTGIENLERSGNRVEYVNGAWWLNRQGAN
jgi:hypothetical protein